MYKCMHLYRYRMGAQHVICAGQVRHATRQTDAKSAEFRYMAGATQLPLLEVRLPTATFCQRQSVAVHNEREVVFFGLIFSMVGLGWEPLLVAQHAGSLVAGHCVLALFLSTVLLGLVQVQHQCYRSLYIRVDILPLIFLILQLWWSLA